MSTHPAKDSKRSPGQADGPRPVRDFKEETRDVLLDAFYRVLNEDATFAASLAEMHRRFPGLRWREGRLPADAATTFSVFIKDRPWLPRGATHDIFSSLDIATEQKLAPQIGIRRTTFIVGAPPLREPIAYDPLTESPQDFLARARHHVREMETAWKSAGWKPIHAKHKSEVVLRREALRLYRRAVLGWKHEPIADEEERETSEYVDPETVRTSVRRWARILGIKRRGEASLRGRMRQATHKGPMPLACPLCRTRNMAPDAWCITYSMDQDPKPVVAVCERCAESITKLVTS